MEYVGPLADCEKIDESMDGYTFRSHGNTTPESMDGYVFRSQGNMKKLLLCRLLVGKSALRLRYS